MITVIDETSTSTSEAAVPSVSSPSRTRLPKGSPCDNNTNRTNSDDDCARKTTTCVSSEAEPLPLLPNTETNKQIQPSMATTKVKYITPTSNSDLMSRLQNFLPQMKSANQELLSSERSNFPSAFSGSQKGKEKSNTMRLDTNLKLDEDSDSDSEVGGEEKPKTNPLIREVGSNSREREEMNENVDVDSAPKKTRNETSGAPTIQLEFTLGNMSDNPLMKLLANDGEDDDDSDTGCDSNLNETVDDPSEVARTKVVANLLQPTAKPIDSNCGSAKGGSKKNSGRKRLITELS